VDPDAVRDAVRIGQLGDRDGASSELAANSDDESILELATGLGIASEPGLVGLAGAITSDVEGNKQQMGIHEWGVSWCVE
jgi:hypothetical protein